MSLPHASKADCSECPDTKRSDSCGAMRLCKLPYSETGFFYMMQTKHPDIDDKQLSEFGRSSVNRMQGRDSACWPLFNSCQGR